MINATNNTPEASDIEVIPTGNLVSNNAQDALNELQSDSDALNVSLASALSDIGDLQTDVANLQAMSSTDEIYYARTLLQTNLNQGSGLNAVRFNTPIIDNAPDITRISDTVIRLQPANYLLLASVYLSSSIMRTNIVLSTSTSSTTRGASGYIRAATGHNDSSVHLADVLNLNSVTDLTINSQREANTGTVFSLARGMIMLRRLRT
jgi:hypothetical protein